MSDTTVKPMVPDPTERPTLTVDETAVILQTPRTLYAALRTGRHPTAAFESGTPYLRPPQGNGAEIQALDRGGR